MHHLALELATIVAMSVAALAGVVGLWQGASVFTIAFRVLISGGLVFFFTLLGAHVLGRSILEDVARAEMERKQKEQEETARQEAAENASSLGEATDEALRTTSGAEDTAVSSTAESGSEAA